MTKRTSLIAIGLAGAAIAAPAPAAHAAPSKGCGIVSADYVGQAGGSSVRITKVTRISCRSARSVVKRCILLSRVPGWTVYNSKGLPPRSELHSRGRVIRFAGLAGGAPKCI